MTPLRQKPLPGPGLADEAHRDQIFGLLSSLLGREQNIRYFANPGNLGDAVIARSTGEVFSALGLHIDGNSSTIVIGGGGNLIPRYGHMRKILEALPRHGKRIILLPMTVDGCFELLAEFEDLTLIARERVTYEHALEYKINASLCHDLAFYMDLGWWSGQPDAGEREQLVNFRIDQESRDTGRRAVERNQDISRVFGNHWWTLETARGPSLFFISEINTYREVITDRLHVAIIAARLNKKVEFHANNYYKNEAVHAYSLASFRNVTYIR